MERVSRRRGSEETTRPTKPSSGWSCSAMATAASMPVRPTARAPALPMAATSCVFTEPASTFSTASMVSSLVTRRPRTNVLFTPRSSRKRVICLPPPCTTVTCTPDAATEAIWAAMSAREAGSSSKLPPTLIRARTLPQPRRFFESQREVQVLNGLAGCTFHQVVDGADHHHAARSGVGNYTDIAEVGAGHSAEVRHVTGLVETDERLMGVLVVVDGENFSGRHGFDRAEIKRFQNAAIEGQQLGGETEFRLLEAAGEQHFRHVAVVEHRVRRKIFRRFAKTCLEGWLAARAANAALGIADDAPFAVDNARFQQRPDGEIRRRWVAAGVGDQPCAPHPVAIKLRQAVDRLGQESARAVLL